MWRRRKLTSRCATGGTTTSWVKHLAMVDLGYFRQFSRFIEFRGHHLARHDNNVSSLHNLCRDSSGRMMAQTETEGPTLVLSQPRRNSALLDVLSHSLGASLSLDSVSSISVIRPISHRCGSLVEMETRRWDLTVPNLERCG